MDTTTLMLSVVFGAIGMGLFAYGKRQAQMVPLLAGLALMAAPYFVPGVLALVVVGGVLVALPFVVAA